jgi:hypothetical protein
MNYSKYTEKLKTLSKENKINVISFEHNSTEKQKNSLHRPHPLIIDYIPTFGS